MESSPLEPDDILLKQGEYWKATKSFKDQGVIKGRIYLLKSIRMAEGRVHTLVLHPHPGTNYTEHRFLEQDFLRHFVPVSEVEARAIRTAELGVIQKKLLALQGEVMEAQSDPEILRGYLAEGIREWEKKEEIDESTANLPLVDTNRVELALTVTTGDVKRMGLAARRVGEEASLTARWIEGKAKLISETAESMAPFFSESAAAALSRTEEVLHVVKRITKGVENLKLWVLDDVLIEKFKEGASASDALRLTIRQAKLYVDEELSAWADVDAEFDYKDVPKFLKELAANPALVEQIFPSARSVVCLATSREADKNYAERGYNVFKAVEAQKWNKEVFLLIRDGENLYEVNSPVESHLAAGRLFPSKAEIDEIFTRDAGWWKRDDPERFSEITYQDTEYTDRLEKHNELALHYKRFLTLLAGLDAHKGIFGKFHNAPPSQAFVSPWFQGQFLDFVHDDEVNPLQLPGSRPSTFKEFVAEKNKALVAGSRVVCDWGAVIDPKTAPGSTRGNDRSYGKGFHLRISLREDASIRTVQRSGKQLIVKAPAGAQYGWQERPDFEATVAISEFRPGYYSQAVGFLVLDACTSRELEYYVFNRQERKDFRNFIRPLKAAMVFLREEEARQAPARQALIDALAEGGLAAGSEAEATADAAIRTWRATNRGAEIPTDRSSKQFRQLLDQMFTLVTADLTVPQVAALAETQGYTPLRLTVTGTAKLTLYAAPKAEERDDRLVPHAWVHRFTVERKKAGFSLTGGAWTVLPEVSNRENVLREWTEAAAWAGLNYYGETFESKAAKFAKASAFSAEGLPLLLRESLTAGEWDDLFETWKAVRRRMSQAAAASNRRVQNPDFYVPVAVCVYKSFEKVRLHYVTLGTYVAERRIASLAPDEEHKQRFVQEFIRPYANKEANREEVDIELGSYPIPTDLQVWTDWTLGSYGLSGQVLQQVDYLASWCDVVTCLPDIAKLPELLAGVHQLVEGPGPNVWVAPEVIERVLALKSTPTEEGD